MWGNFMLTRTTILIVCFLAIALLPESAQADNVKLKDSGQLVGKIESVTFLADGEEATHVRKDVASVVLAPGKEDLLRLRDGKSLKGKIVSVVFKGKGGPMTLARARLERVEIKRDPILEARRSILAMKRAKLAPDDAAGLLELAKWARDKRLEDEAAELALACTKIDPIGKTGDEAHKLLGHVLFDGEWMTTAEMEKRKRIEEGNLTPAQPVKAEPSEQEKHAANLKGVKAIASPAERNEKLQKIFLAKTDALRRRELKAVLGTYTAERKRLNEKIEVEEAELAKLKNRSRTIGSVHVRNPGGGLVHGRVSNQAQGLLRDSIRASKGRRVKLDRAKRRTMAELAKRAKRRRTHVNDMYQHFKRELKAGKEIALEQMVAKYKAAVK